MKNSLHEEGNIIHELQMQNDNLKQEIFQQKLSLENSGFSKQAASEEAKILFDKGEQQRNGLNDEFTS